MIRIHGMFMKIMHPELLRISTHSHCAFTLYTDQYQPNTQMHLQLTFMNAYKILNKYLKGNKPNKHWTEKGSTLKLLSYREKKQRENRFEGLAFTVRVGRQKQATMSNTSTVCESMEIELKQ